MPTNTLNNKTKGAPGNTLKPADNIITFRDEYPLLSALKDIGIAAKLRNGRIALAPADKITHKIESKVRQYNDSIVDEIQRLNLAQAESQAESFEIQPSANRYADPAHDLEMAYQEWVLAYELAAELYNAGNKSPIWTGDIPDLSKPNETVGGGDFPKPPFYWVHNVRLVNPNDKTVEYKYWCMFRDVDNKDSVVVEQKLRDMLKKKQAERGF